MADEEEAGEEGKGGAVPWGLKKLAPGAAKVEAVRIPAATTCRDLAGLFVIVW